MDAYPLHFLIPFLLAFGLVAGIMPFARRLARKSGFVDRPGGRKDHARDVPPVGGLVIFPFALIVAWVCGGLDPGRDGPFVVGLAMLLALGAVDDSRGLPAGFRFAVQIGAACLLVIAGGTKIMTLGDLFGFGDIMPGAYETPLTIFCVVLLINAMNMIDGLDGLAGGLSLSALLWILLTPGEVPDTTLALAVAGGVAGFLVYNMRNPLRRKACVFLGDSGSMALGLTLAWVCIRASQGSDATLSPVSVAWILGVPIMDAFALFVTRLSRGRHPFAADRRHFHHRFLDARMAPGRVSALILTLGFTFGAIGVWGIGIGVPEPVLMALWIALLLLNTAVCFGHGRFVAVLAARRGLELLDPANDIDKSLVDPHGQGGDKNSKLQGNP